MVLSEAYSHLGSAPCLCDFLDFQYPVLHGQAIAFDSSVAPCLPGHCLCMVNLVARTFIYVLYDSPKFIHKEYAQECVLCDSRDHLLLFTSAWIYSCCSLMHES